MAGASAVEEEDGGIVDCGFESALPVATPVDILSRAINHDKSVSLHLQEARVNTPEPALSQGFGGDTVAILSPVFAFSTSSNPLSLRGAYCAGYCDSGRGVDESWRRGRERFRADNATRLASRISYCEGEDPARRIRPLDSLDKTLGINGSLEY